MHVIRGEQERDHDHGRRRGRSKFFAVVEAEGLVAQGLALRISGAKAVILAYHRLLLSIASATRERGVFMGGSV